VFYPVKNIVYKREKIWYTYKKIWRKNMPRYKVTLTENEVKELKECNYSVLFG